MNFKHKSFIYKSYNAFIYNMKILKSSEGLGWLFHARAPMHLERRVCGEKLW